jgi:hypothetical protein
MGGMDFGLKLAPRVGGREEEDKKTSTVDVKG